MYSIALVLAVLFVGSNPRHWTGPSVQLDPTFSYYRDRSPRSIASEIRANGYRVVRYVVTADSTVQRELIDEMHRAGLTATFVTFANGTYSTKDLPPRWERWRMVTRSDLEGKPLNDGYTRLCLNQPGYRAWKKAQIESVMKAHPFDGIDLVEPHWPEYPGATAPAYACFCDECKAAFRRAFPTDADLPDIVNPGSPRSPRNNPRLWDKWLTFRTSTLTSFLDDLVNGDGGIRRKLPRARVCTWTLALMASDGPRRVREDSGEDAGLIVRTVKPDMHCFQTHWPDWLVPELAPDYVRAYRPFVDAVRAVAPRVPLMIQADTGSQKANRRSWSWIRAFERACHEMGVSSTTIYEYFIGLYMYTDPPRVERVLPVRGGLELHFTKRVDPTTAANTASYLVDGAAPVRCAVDGNIVVLHIDGALRPGALVVVRGVNDDSDRRLFPDMRPAVLDRQEVTVRRR